MMTTCVAALYDVGSHDRPPPACGQTIFVVPSPGTRFWSMIFAPVFGSMDLTTF